MIPGRHKDSTFINIIHGRATGIQGLFDVFHRLLRLLLNGLSDNVAGIEVPGYALCQKSGKRFV